MTLTTPPLTEAAGRFLLEHDCLIEEEAHTVMVHFPPKTRIIEHPSGSQTMLLPDGCPIHVRYYPAHDLHSLTIPITQPNPANVRNVRRGF